jgi:hypothetical protein
MIPVPCIPRIQDDEIVIIPISMQFPKKKYPLAGKDAPGNVTAKQRPVFLTLTGNLTTQGNQKPAYNLNSGNTKWA